MKREKMDLEQTRQMLLYVCDRIIAAKPYLTELDSKIGDGDHGIGMANGMEQAKQKLTWQKDFEHINQLFQATGMTMLNSMGGASGVIFGTLFLGGVKGLAPVSELNRQVLVQWLQGSLAAIKQRGKAQVGDKTMVDALEPAVRAMAAAQTTDLTELLKTAVEAAEVGVEATKQYVAKFGRAKSLLERAIGHQDAGATSVSIILQAMYDYVKGLPEKEDQ